MAQKFKIGQKVRVLDKVEGGYLPNPAIIIEKRNQPGVGLVIKIETILEGERFENWYGPEDLVPLLKLVE